ncbi:uncharacterized protein LOC142179615 [Nicotiana tabacum]|uniref:Uncharacterized protein LOC142179615 n=2 Tax=Nicotiana TaxID=4085 RepID=A0AC58UBT0_TOBAC
MDKIGFWNIRGLNNSEKQKKVNLFMHNSQAGLFGLLETKVKRDKAERAALNLCNGPWAVMGDFNCILHRDKRIGIPVTMSEIRKFKQCVEECTLQDMKSSRSFFTWNNKQGGADRVYSRIDRVLVNNEWILALPDSEVYYRNKGTFDHCPAIISWAGDQKKQYIFRYFNMWSLTPDYEEKVKQGWKTTKKGTKMYELVGKLNSLKSKLRQLNRERFRQIEKQTDQIQEELMQC